MPHIVKMCTFAAVMSTAAIIINIIFVLCLTSPVITRSVSLVTADDEPGKKLWVSLLFGLTQGVAATIGYNISRMICHLFVYIADYLVFAMMIVVAVKLFVDSMKVLKGKMLYTVRNNRDILALTAIAATNTLLMSLMCCHFMPFGLWFLLAVVVAGFLWAFITVRIDFAPGMIKKVSFVEFSAAVFMVVVSVLYLFTDLI